MTNLISKDPKEIVAEHIEALRAYAARVLINGEQLTDDEQTDKSERFQELQALCASFDVTEKEMVALVLKQTMREPKRCGCPTCRTRLEMNNDDNQSRRDGSKR